MNKNKKTVKLTEQDKNTIINHSHVCTDSHGSGCSTNSKNEHNKKLH